MRVLVPWVYKPANRRAEMTDQSADGIRDRLTKGGEDAIGRVAQELLENPVVSSALARAFEARERATQAQEVAMGALNLPSAADLERLTRRVRSLAQRLEGIEDSVDRLDERLSKNVQLSLEETLASIDQRLAAIEAALPAPKSS